MRSILLRMKSNGEVEWMDDAGEVTTGWPTSATYDRLTVLVPAEDVLLLEIGRVPGNQRLWSKAIPFLVEDLLVLPIEAQHVAWKWLGDDRPILVCVVAHARMEEWTNRLREVGLEPEVMVPESLALPFHGDAPSLLIDGEHALLRLTHTQALSGRTDEIVAIVNSMEPALEPHTWLVAEGQAPFPPRTTTVVAHALHAFSLRDGALSLLQGAYTTRKRLDGLARHWRRTTVLASIALLLLASYPVIDRQKLTTKIAEQRREMQTLYRQMVPGTKVVEDPAILLKSALANRGLGQSSGALQVLARVAPVIAADSRLSLDSIEYRDRRLELIVQSEGVSDLDRLRQSLVRDGLKVEIAGTMPGTNGTEGRLRVWETP